MQLGGHEPCICPPIGLQLVHYLRNTYTKGNNLSGQSNFDVGRIESPPLMYGTMDIFLLPPPFSIWGPLPNGHLVFLFAPPSP